MMTHKMLPLIFTIAASIFLSGHVHSHPTESSTILSPIDKFGLEVYDVKKIKILSKKEVMDIVKMYIPEEEMKHMTFIENGQNAGYGLGKWFETYVRSMAQPKMTFREYFGLHLYKTYAHQFLHPSKIREDDALYTAFETARALISLGERLQHHEIDMRRNFKHEAAQTSSTSSNTVNRAKISATLWRGEVRNRNEIDNLLSTNKYTTGDNFVSFTKGKYRVVRFMVSYEQKDNQIRVIYKYENAGPLYHLDVARAYSDTDYEDEIILYPTTEFEILGSQDLVYDNLVPYKLIRIGNVKSVNYEKWRTNNYKILKSYYEAARKKSTNFQSAALQPKNPSKKPLKKAFQRLLPCVH